MQECPCLRFRQVERTASSALQSRARYEPLLDVRDVSGFVVPGVPHEPGLVDQERGEWTLYALAEGWQRYQVAAGGKYGEQIPLPPPFGFEIATADWPR